MHEQRGREIHRVDDGLQLVERGRRRLGRVDNDTQ